MKRYTSWLVIGLLVLCGAQSGFAKGEKAAPAAASSSSSQGSDKFMNIRVNPLGLVFGLINADIDFKVADAITVGPSLMFWSLAGITAFGGGARGNYYFNGQAFTDSFYLGAHAEYALVTYKTSLGNSSAGVFGAGALAGYHWVWDGGFNIMLGGGIGYYAGSSTVTINGQTASVTGLNGVSPALEFTLGWAF